VVKIAVLPAPHTGQKLKDFLGTKDHRQGLRLFRARMMSSKVQSFLRVTLYRNRSAEMALRIEPVASFFSFVRQTS
jgi:hypothetical protein